MARAAVAVARNDFADAVANPNSNDEAEDPMESPMAQPNNLSRSLIHRMNSLLGRRHARRLADVAIVLQIDRRTR